jgi:hypothetical protein
MGPAGRRIVWWLIAAAVIVTVGAALVVIRRESAEPPPLSTAPDVDGPVTGSGAAAPPSPVARPGSSSSSTGGGGGATPITSRFDEVDAALQELIAGNVAFNTPQRMHFHEIHTIALIASPQLDPATLSEELRKRIGGNDPVAVAPVQIAPLMEAQLGGAPAFEVTPLTPIRQPVSRAAPTEWRWTVMANETGTHTLQLTINAVVTVAGERFPRSLNVLSRDIEVYITTRQRVGTFLAGNWQWLLGTIVIPLAVWFWSNSRKQKRRHRK